jgi:tetratricopeptide (TPR) repeat protein
MLCWRMVESSAALERCNANAHRRRLFWRWWAKSEEYEYMDHGLSLDVVGFLEGTTKSSVWTDYLRHYERHLWQYRDKEIQILEIGVLGGSSLRMWQYYFPKATLIGIDIDKNCLTLADDRIVIEIGSQDDPAFLAELAKKYKPTIIIDDGSHIAHHVIHTFERLFPFLLADGLYIIEDLFFHVGPHAAQYRGAAPITPPEYLLELARMLVREGIDPSKNYGNWAYFRKNIDEVAFVPNGAVFIRKKQDSNTAGLIAQAEAYAQQKHDASHWGRAADYIMKKGDLARAEAAARSAIDLDPNFAQAHLVLSQIHKTGGNIDGALVSAQKATELASGDSKLWQNLGQLYLAAKENDKAIAAFEKGLTANSGHFELYQSLSQVLERQMKIVDAQSALKRGLAAGPSARWSGAFEQALTRLKAMA